MKLVKIDPPGTFCHYEAVLELIDRLGGNTFLEVGCGAGDLSVKLLERGFSGVGVDFSEDAIEIATRRLKKFIDNDQYHLVKGNILDLSSLECRFDFGLSMMVMEHIEDDLGFLKKIKSFIKPNGHVIVAVPGRRDKWSFEDETVGHLRRYDREDLLQTLGDAGLDSPDVWSVAVPTANLLFGISNLLVKRSSESQKLTQSKEEQTKSSGIREIPFKTVFPPAFRLILNRYSLFPLLITQRLFYRTGLGLTMLGFGKVQ